MKVICKYYTFYIRDLNIWGFWYLWGVLELILKDTERQLHSEKGIEISDDVCGFVYISVQLVFTSCVSKLSY